MPAAVGLTYISAHGPGAVLKYPPEVRPVYANDKLKIDPVGGKIEHEFNPLADRGKLVLWYTKLEYIDGRIETPYVRQEDVEAIERNYGNTNSPAYKKSLMDMHLKTATKKLLKRPASESEGLAMALADDDAAEMEPVRTVEPSPPRDVGERMADRLDKAVDKIKPAEKIEEQEEDEAPGQDERHADDTPPPEGNDLF
jgi:recombinational DNA repair protein RecT